MELFREGGVREGNRGGLGLFKWEDAQKDVGKECYLGNTVRASQGRWQNHKNIHWFAIKKEEVNTSVELDEIAEIKRREAEAMAEALGGAALIPDEQIAEDMKNEIKQKLTKSTKVEKVIGIGLKGQKKRDYERELRREINQRDYSPKKSSKEQFKEHYNERGRSEKVSKTHRSEIESRNHHERSRSPKYSKSRRDSRDRSRSPHASSSRKERRDRFSKDSGSQRYKEDNNRSSNSKQTESRYKEDRSKRESRSYRNDRD